MFLPDWLDYVRSENTATSMFRGLRGISADWGELIATAQSTMSIYQDRRIPEMVERLYDYESTNTLPLVAASRILDSASQAPAGLPEENRVDLGLCAAVSFGMYGNFPSAKAAINRIKQHNSLELSSSISAIIGTASPDLLPEMLQYCEVNSPEKLYLETLEAFLQTGATENIDEIRQALIECLLNAPSSFENSLFRSCRLCLEHIFNLSLARVLHAYCDSLSRAYISQLIDKGIRILLPPQFKAIAHHNLPLHEGNALVSLPTSTGKTLLGELCLVAALQQKPGLVCYLVPYVALGNQVAQTFQEHLPKQYKVKRLIGGYREDRSLEPEREMEVVVATPERLDALLRISPHLIPYIRCVVCDEAHGIQNDIRGIRLEGILTRLRLLQERGCNSRIVLLSAVLNKYNDLQNWMQIEDESVITDTWKPTARRLIVWKEDGKLTLHIGDDPIRTETARNDSKLGELLLPWVERGFRSTSHLKEHQKIREVQGQKKRVNKNIAYLVDFLVQNYESPILCVCATKADTRKVAVALADRFPEIDPLPEMISKAISQIESYHRSLKPLGEILKHGVAFHNASVPHKIRQTIEQAIKRKEVIAVAATTTLAEGVDLPFRFTIIVDWLTWQGEEVPQPMSSLLFKNIAGRCGRAGVFTEGDTIIFDNPIGNEDFTKPYDYREEIQRNRFLSDNPDDAELTSAVEEIFGTRIREQKNALKSVLASQFMAAIPENPDAENLETLFSRALFSSHRIGSDTQTNEILSEIRISLEDETQGALARAHSPLRLTDFGQQANKTGFSPDSCRRIVLVLQGSPPHEEAGNLFDLLDSENANPKRRLVATASKLLRELGTLPEQPNHDMKKELSGTRVRRLRVKPENFENVLTLWLEGEYEEIIFSELPSVKRSKAKGRPSINKWAEGAPEISEWDAEFDRFTDLMSSVFINFLPWLMRACDYLGTISQGWATGIDWQEWADMLEKGVSSRWALAAIDKDAPVSRKSLFLVGSVLPSIYLAETDPLGVSSIKNDLNIRQQFEDIFLGLANQHSDIETLRNDIVAVYKWLWEQANLPIIDIFG